MGIWQHAERRRRRARLPGRKMTPALYDSSVSSRPQIIKFVFTGTEITTKRHFYRWHLAANSLLILSFAGERVGVVALHFCLLNNGNEPRRNDAGARQSYCSNKNSY